MASKSIIKYDDFDSFISICKQHVNAINSYEGDDPLDAWYKYLLWMEQNFVINFKKETIFNEILLDSLIRFENDKRYKQDRRLIKMFIKHIHFQNDPHRHYRAMIANGFGTQVADLYINWSYYLEMSGQHEKADQTFKNGFSAQAKPFDLLKSAHEDFGFSFSQQILHKSNEVRLQENRQRLEQRFDEMSSLCIDRSTSYQSKSLLLQTHDKAEFIEFCIPRGQLVDETPSKLNNNISVTRDINDSIEILRRKRDVEGSYGLMSQLSSLPIVSSSAKKTAEKKIARNLKHAKREMKLKHPRFVINLYQKFNTPTIRHVAVKNVLMETKRKPATQQLNAIPFEIYVDEIESMERAIENDRVVLNCQTSGENKENISFHPNKSVSQKCKHKTNTSIEEEIAAVNKMIDSVLNPHNQITIEGAPDKEKSIFKEPPTPKQSFMKAKPFQRPNETRVCDLLDTTEDFELMEAQCTNSPEILRRKRDNEGNSSYGLMSPLSSLPIVRSSAKKIATNFQRAKRVIKLKRPRFAIYPYQKLRATIPHSLSPKKLLFSPSIVKENVENRKSLDLVQTCEHEAGLPTDESMTIITPKNKKIEYSFSYELLETTADFERMEALCAVSPEK